MPTVHPSLWERGLGAVLRSGAGLPARAKRAIAGAPARLDGQQLDLDVQKLLRLAALAPRPPKSSVEDVRRRSRRSARVLAGPPIPMPKVEKLAVSGPEGRLGARLYTPPGGRAPLLLLVYFHGGGWVGFPPQSTTRWPPRAGRTSTPPSSEPTRPGSPPAATARAVPSRRPEPPRA